MRRCCIIGSLIHLNIIKSHETEVSYCNGPHTRISIRCSYCNELLDVISVQLNRCLLTYFATDSRIEVFLLLNEATTKSIFSHVGMIFSFDKQGLDSFFKIAEDDWVYSYWGFGILIQFFITVDFQEVFFATRIFKGFRHIFSLLVYIVNFKWKCFCWSNPLDFDMQTFFNCLLGVMVVVSKKTVTITVFY